MNFLKDRNLIIVVIVLVLLVGGFYLTRDSNDSSDNGSNDTNQEEQQNNDENKDENKDEEESKPQGVVSTSPAANAEVALAEAPSEVVIKFDKEIAGGSEIKVVSDKGIDVVPSANKITSDLKTLSVPVTGLIAGTYTVTYNINWNDGTKSDGSYKFTLK